MGEQGSGKSTVARGLAMVLEGAYPLGVMAHVCSEGIVSLWSREAKDFECTDLEAVPSDVVAVFREYLPAQFAVSRTGQHGVVITLERKPANSEQKQPPALDVQEVGAIDGGVNREI